MTLTPGVGFRWTTIFLMMKPIPEKPCPLGESFQTVSS